jgi:hypothetical protein
MSKRLKYSDDTTFAYSSLLGEDFFSLYCYGTSDPSRNPATVNLSMSYMNREGYSTMFSGGGSDERDRSVALSAFSGVKKILEDFIKSDYKGSSEFRSFLYESYHTSIWIRTSRREVRIQLMDFDLYTGEIKEIKALYEFFCFVVDKLALVGKLI